MTEEQMRTKSAEKVKQIMDLMKTLNIRTEARERMDTGGFIEKVVFWIDDEKYEGVPAVPAGSPPAPEDEQHV